MQAAEPWDPVLKLEQELQAFPGVACTETVVPQSHMLTNPETSVGTGHGLSEGHAQGLQPQRQCLGSGINGSFTI